MVRICCDVIIGVMASHTSIGSVGIITVVTGSAVIGDFSVRAGDGIKLIVCREGCRTPSQSSRVAGSAISGNAKKFMIRI